MKFLILAVAVFGLINCFASGQTVETQLRILLPVGCNINDKRILSQNIYGNRAGRNLRSKKAEGNDLDSNQGTNDIDHRSMIATFTKPNCKNACSGFVSLSCLAPACKGYRRELEDVTSANRDLQDGDWCSSAKNRARDEILITTIHSLVSRTCASALRDANAVQMDCLDVTC